MENEKKNGFGLENTAAGIMGVVVVTTIWVAEVSFKVKVSELGSVLMGGATGFGMCVGHEMVRLLRAKNKNKRS
ncbi:hypothetical protein HYS97_01125 [Candidatus Daviesbacteria bacterium]|nr:hypothetical protein [Candidatus Daviesbacteria bacterium]